LVFDDLTSFLIDEPVNSVALALKNQTLCAAKGIDVSQIFFYRGCFVCFVVTDGQEKHTGHGVGSLTDWKRWSTTACF
jgi:hypothetical protein